MSSRNRHLALLAGTALGLLPAAAPAATEIGVAAAVNPMAHGFPPAREMRVLQVGTDITANEQVVTGPRGQAQLLFLDGSALTVGPNSEVVLDEFVYDPATRNGRLAFAATKGVFRLVGGQLSKQSPVLIKTPTATVGVRGGIALTQIGDDGVNATFLFGDEMTVESDGATERATRPGFSIQAPPDGPPSPPAPVDGRQLDETLGAFEGGADQTGGLENPPTDEDVARTQIATTNSVQGAAGAPSGGGRTLGADGGRDPQNEAVDASQNEMAGAALDDAMEGGATPPPDNGGGDDGGGPPPVDPGEPAGVDIPGTLSGRFRLGSEGVGAENGAIGDVPFAGATVANGVFTGGGMSLPVQDGAFQVPPTALPPFDGATFEGNGWLSANRDFLFYELEDAVGQQRLLAFAGTPTPASAFPTTGFTAYEFRSDFVLGSDVPFIRTGGVGFGSAAPAKGYIDWSTNRFLLGKFVIEGQGPSQRTAGGVIVGQTVGLGDPSAANIEGGFRGSSRVPTASTPYFFSSSGPQEMALPGSDGAAFFGADGPNHFVLGVDVIESGPNAVGNFGPNIVAQKTVGTQGARTTATLNGFVGGLAQRIGPDPDVFAIANNDGSLNDFEIRLDAPSGTLSGDFDVNDDSGYGITLSFGGSDAAESAFFDNDTFAATENGLPVTVGFDSTGDYTFFLATADALELIDALPFGVALCACQYLRWGVIGLDVGNSQDPNDRVQIQLAGWVAGEATQAIDLPAGGLATYEGHVFGNVQNAGSFYSAFGKLNITFSFDNPTSSTVTITNFDGVNYEAPVISCCTGGIYSGFAFEQGPLGDRSLSFKAAFFTGGGDPTVETGGQFSITNNNDYQAAGVMAAARKSFVPSN